MQAVPPAKTHNRGSFHHCSQAMRPSTLQPFISSRLLIGVSALLVALTGCGGGSDAAVDPVDPLKADASYGVEGTVRLDAPAPSVVALQPDGKLLLAGSRQTGQLPPGNYGGAAPREVFVRRLTTNGVVDTTFGTNGEVRFTLKGSDRPSDLKLQKSGRIVLAVLAGQPCAISIPSLSAPCLTESGTHAERSTNLVALRPDGAFDRTFGQNGVADTDADQSGLNVSLAVRDDQSLALLRSTGLARARIYGRRLDLFSANGVKQTLAPQLEPQPGCEAFGRSVLIQGSGRIVSAGDQGLISYADPAVHPGVCIAIHDSTSGRQTGGAWTRFDGNYGFFSLVPATGDGFLATGQICHGSECQLGVARYEAEGILQTSYGTDGIARMPIPPRSAIQSTLALPDGRLVVLASTVVYDNDGNNPRYSATWLQLGSDGAPVAQFGNRGMVTTELSTIAPIHLIQDNQGRWLVVSVDQAPAVNASVFVQRSVGYSQR